MANFVDWNAMANPEHVAKLREGAEAWNEWRKSSGQKPDLSGLQLQRASFDEYNLTSADFSHARLTGIGFRNADCTEASFEQAILIDATFYRADLIGATFKGATLLINMFVNCLLIGTDFTEVRFADCTFAGGTLRGARGLDTTRTSYYNSIGLDIFFESGGLPDSFLRASGVPEEFIQYAASLDGKAIDYYSCFLSYSSKDDEFAKRLHEGLQGKNIRTWFAPEDLKIGDRFRRIIDEKIRLHDKLVLILSANSVASDWVETEVESALERERKEQRDVLFPIAIDDEGFDSQQPWAADIRRKRQIGDFRRWKQHDDYTRAFEKLVRDLKKSQPPIIMRG